AVGLRDAAQLGDRAHQRPPVRGKPEPPVAAAGVGSTSTSPSETPLMISVSAGPETPIRTGTTASTPSRRTVTVLRSPVVVIACVGAFSTPVAVPVVMDTFAVAPTPTPGGAVSNEIVTGQWPTSFDTVPCGFLRVTAPVAVAPAARQGVGHRRPRAG